MVVEEQAEPDEPGRPHVRHVRQDEAHRPDDVRRRPQQHLALDQRLADQPELVIFEVAQAAMDQLAAARRGALGEVVLLAQQHLEAAAGGVAGDAGAVDAAADDDEVERLHRRPALSPSSSFSCRIAAVLVGGVGLGPRPVALEALLDVRDLGLAQQHAGRRCTRSGSTAWRSSRARPPATAPWRGRAGGDHAVVGEDAAGASLERRERRRRTARPCRRWRRRCSGSFGPPAAAIM